MFDGMIGDTDYKDMKKAHSENISFLNNNFDDFEDLIIDCIVISLLRMIKIY